MNAHISLIFGIFLMTLTGTICVRHELNGPFLARLRLAQQQPPEIPDDVLSYDEIYNDIKYPDQFNNNLNTNNNNINYLSNWPVLRDYVQNDNNDNYLKKAALINAKVQDQLDDIPSEPLPTPLPNKMKFIPNKGYNEKRNNNNHYMSLCHFKICNMGRKRNTRYLHLWNLLENFKQSLRKKFYAMYN